MAASHDPHHAFPLPNDDQRQLVKVGQDRGKTEKRKREREREREKDLTEVQAKAVV